MNKKSAPKKSVPFRGKGKTLALSSVLRPLKVFWEDFTLNKARRYRLRASCNVLFRAMQKSEVGRLRVAPTQLAPCAAREVYCP